MNPAKLLNRAQFHGAHRLADPKHRLYWVVAMLVMLFCALGILSEMVGRFLDAPTNLIKMDTVNTALPFPAVLICPEITFPEEKIEAFLATAKYSSGVDAESIRPIINQLAAFFSPDVPYTFLELAKVQQFLHFNGLDVEEAGLLLMATCEETLIRELRSNIRQNSKYSGVLTSEMGMQSSLAIVVNQSQKLSDIDLTYKWVVVQSRQRYVDIAKNGTPLSPGFEQWTAFWTKSLFITEDLSYMSDSLLGCRINNKQLNYFPVYNEKNCLVECHMRLTLQKCRCLLPVHYRPFGTPICNVMDLPCAREALNVMFDKTSCDCPFTCEYEIEFIENSNFAMTADASSYDTFYDGLDLSKVTVLRVFVKSHESASNSRRPIFNFHDLFSQLGGVFNVFFGCSILTLLELLQLAWHTIRYRSKIAPIKKLDPETEKSVLKKKDIFLRGIRVCCRVRKTKMGRVKKTVATKKTVTFIKLSKKDSLKAFIH